MNGTDLFHTGIITDTFEATLAELTDLFGYAWCPEVSLAMEVVLPDAVATLDLRFAYSRTEPRLEIIQSIAGSLWTPAVGSGIHHLGYWSEDLEADQARLEASGFVTEARGVRPDGATYWGYYRRDGGHRVELVSREVKAGMEAMWAAS